MTDKELILLDTEDNRIAAEGSRALAGALLALLAGPSRSLGVYARFRQLVTADIRQRRQSLAVPSIGCAGIAAGVPI